MIAVQSNSFVEIRQGIDIVLQHSVQITAIVEVLSIEFVQFNSF
jgi:hypothetical protein